MVDAHTDEVGLMIISIQKNGMLGFRAVGGLDQRLLLAKRVVIGEKRIKGVILAPPIHLSGEDELERVIKMEQLAIDIGAGSEEEAKGLVKLGDYATIDTHFEVLSEDGLRTVKGKAFDDRAGCAVAAALATVSTPWTSTFPSAPRKKWACAAPGWPPTASRPTWASPGRHCLRRPAPQGGRQPDDELGKGPAITIMDHSFIADKRLVRLLTDAAEANGIPYQFKQPGIGGTDAGAIHLSRSGVPSVTVAVPCRYIHNPVSILSLNDFDNTVAS